ncbi:uncharacterized protein THITE_2090214 [Thermothielavioides terrestris NRRL 8126]|uniref:Tautomerase cis-CaaD-like domain-containing protein n=1 Tax=Thermothielavioides terrestris (strain ATCC 38088 / NRRL 8126) TaxID=578455 RepID=G2R9F9_THETT|nr:uncharacterized protein THITE_2090214 [Thermothielavioides terrestris NRRL 8126]AEO68700.1 hypothetical protein THITE_2090214 [Thermothielavioides terrestris NRRL 8126]
MKMLSLYRTTTLLIDLHFTLHWASPATEHHQPGTSQTPTQTPTHHEQQQQDSYHHRHLCTQKFPPTAFAAALITDPSDPSLFLASLDAACLARIRAATRHTMYAFDEPVHFEVERAFVFGGLEHAARLPMRGLTAAEVESQVELMRQRGLRDHVRVDMAVEIEAGKELRERGWDVARGPEGWRLRELFGE